MITKEDLQRLRENQQKPHFSSEAKSMFINGNFNSDNWNGGDGVVRQFCKHLEDRVYYDATEEKFVIPLVSHEIESNNGDRSFNSNLHICYSCHEDMKFLTIISNGYFYDEHTDSDWFTDVYVVQWNKERGQTEKILYNGSLITEEEYIVLLDMIERTGFKFDI